MTKQRKVVEETNEYLVGDPPTYLKTKTIKREVYGFWIPSHGFWFWPNEEDQDRLYKLLSQPPSKLDGQTIKLERSMQMNDDEIETLEERPATEEEKEKIKWLA